MGYGFFTDDSDLPLPHPPIAWPLLVKIEEAVGAAWTLLRDDPPSGFDLKTAEENDITLKLQTALFDRVMRNKMVEGFNRQVFTVGTRGAEVQNFDGSRRDMKPDLLIGFVDRPLVRVPTQDWLFIECKPVGSKHGVEGHYCRKGIARFIRGEYAWTMTEALMIGYTTADHELLRELELVLKKGLGEFSVTEAPTPCRRTERTLFGNPVCTTEHAREFNYIETGKPAPQIRLRHLWLRRD
ncbi:MAG: hypothetical protein PCFJNLEI_00932 [Verrucomicrobiae bacterium]|nr:hypothetical protein [Verrucomicrobiae bacterium]